MIAAAEATSDSKALAVADIEAGIGELEVTGLRI